MVNRPDFRLANWRQHPGDLIGAVWTIVLALLAQLRRYVHGLYAVGGLFLSLGLGLSVLGLWALVFLTGWVRGGKPSASTRGCCAG